MQGYRRPVGEEHDKDDEDEERMQHESGEDLDDRKHADAEIDFLEQEGVFED